jgi:hypothetical protein
MVVFYNDSKVDGAAYKGHVDNPMDESPLPMLAHDVEWS